MSYAQTNYQQIQGIRGKYTIHDIGCFITSFCNLLLRFGHGIDPASLNSIFVQRGFYIDVDDGIRDDVAWDTITKYDPNLVVTSTGGASTPPSANAIVKFAYNSFQTGRPTTHFCLVDHIANGVVYVLDSWDGIVKDAAHYGGVKAWATYEYKLTTNQGGTNVTLTSDDVQQLYRNILGRDGDAGGIKNYTGKTLAFALADMMGSQEFKNRMQGMYQVTKTVEVPVNTGSAATPRQLAAEKAIDSLSAAINTK